MTTEKKFNKRHNQGVRKEQTPNSDDGVPSKNGRNFHIVGIGASAGGLEIKKWLSIFGRSGRCRGLRLPSVPVSVD